MRWAVIGMLGDGGTKNGLLFGEPVEGETAWDRRGTFGEASGGGGG